ncbi:uncharacterized protein MONBRDRAFT_9900 [Monosiga brevicollis MX1]|uniref:Uncharacterized protein n=1 Tax=Monosiga brevicollis TaxID=81824 RepID=A9V4K2_MONBE|nr:uncharacterized protein MONBRDRAFT_9900 [Monosiga brevicollis MX1]EDQ87468.1 predicted protein [Monosiga brevicollis MX1]|eukprot:XP_001747728.1 hypothetical protein [Monosiga brevicollis MX1]
MIMGGQLARAAVALLALATLCSSVDHVQAGPSRSKTVATEGAGLVSPTPLKNAFGGQGFPPPFAILPSGEVTDSLAELGDVAEAMKFDKAEADQHNDFSGWPGPFWLVNTSLYEGWLSTMRYVKHKPTNRCAVIWTVGMLVRSVRRVHIDFERYSKYLAAIITARDASAHRASTGLDLANVTHGHCDPTRVNYMLAMDDIMWEHLTVEGKATVLDRFDTVVTSTPFDVLMETIPPVAFRMQNDPTLAIHRLLALIGAPYSRVMALDTDNVACRVGWELAFGLLEEYDIVTVQGPVPFGGSCHKHETPYPPVRLAKRAFILDYENYEEVNIGTWAIDYHNPHTRQLMLAVLDAWVSLSLMVSGPNYDRERDGCVQGDQLAYRIAMYAMQRRLDIFKDVSSIHSRLQCRTGSIGEQCTHLHTPRRVPAVNMSLSVCSAKQPKNVPLYHNVPEADSYIHFSYGTLW